MAITTSLFLPAWHSLRRHLPSGVYRETRNLARGESLRLGPARPLQPLLLAMARAMNLGLRQGFGHAHMWGAMWLDGGWLRGGLADERLPMAAEGILERRLRVAGLAPCGQQAVHGDVCMGFGCSGRTKVCCETMETMEDGRRVPRAPTSTATPEPEAGAISPDSERRRDDDETRISGASGRGAEARGVAEARGWA
jgi:hypothetical protein